MKPARAGERETGRLKPLESERASRNESEPAYESLETRKDESGQDPRRKGSQHPGGEKMTETPTGTFRGKVGQRALKEQSGTWETHPSDGSSCKAWSGRQ